MLASGARGPGFESPHSDHLYGPAFGESSMKVVSRRAIIFATGFAGILLIATPSMAHPVDPGVDITPPSNSAPHDWGGPIPPTMNGATHDWGTLPNANNLPPPPPAKIPNG